MYHFFLPDCLASVEGALFFDVFSLGCFFDNRTTAPAFILVFVFGTWEICLDAFATGALSFFVVSLFPFHLFFSCVCSSNACFALERNTLPH